MDAHDKQGCLFHVLGVALRAKENTASGATSMARWHSAEEDLAGGVTVGLSLSASYLATLNLSCALLASAASWESLSGWPVVADNAFANAVWGHMRRAERRVQRYPCRDTESKSSQVARAVWSVASLSGQRAYRASPPQSASQPHCLQEFDN